MSTNNTIVSMNAPSSGAAFWDVFSEDLAAPEVRSTWARREHVLMAATLAQAVRDCEILAQGKTGGTYQSSRTLADDLRREREEMQAFIRHGSLDWPFSLPSICTHLGFDLKAMQRRLASVLEGQIVPRTWRGAQTGQRHRILDTEEARRRSVEQKRAHRARGGK